ncbi:tRNA 2-thiocytidine biosynthesis protein TtcA [Aquisalinus flavus]|uniref:tRNA-cytidine(32) 2-sulfurtransferase n=1 Tax=Aquisalinus flavus TaxID=1526572 RepID=A0A8J2V7F2_9PROT|nr:tRNA 2-thiocytidine(32) synthetase TtcA [Aquisalinus flavus]MBD0428087.1 tRNA 2-thiocytidine(32) synthetase TtcA [Aquisalinus flavus]GGD18762.1 tRNA 2-thiocytidine biosynthesis protein TtcA [Aquisalinus flavus]
MTDLLDHPDAIALLRHAPQTTAFNKLRKRLNRLTREAMDTYGMLANGHAKGERWLVCLSGGKDSWAMLGILMDLNAQGLLQADLLACNLDQGQPGFPASTIPDFLDSHGIAHRIEYRDTYSVVMDKVPAGKTYCSLCSRLRRGNLYRIAREEGCSSVVLGHHREDALETFLLNLFHGGTLAAMPPKLLNDEGDLTVLRPLALCAEEDLAKYAAALSFPIIPCDLCGSQDGLQRQAMKQLLDEWERRSPGRKDTIFRALSHVKPGHMLDPALFDFAGLAPRK